MDEGRTGRRSPSPGQLVQGPHPADPSSSSAARLRGVRTLPGACPYAPCHPRPPGALGLPTSQLSPTGATPSSLTARGSQRTQTSRDHLSGPPGRLAPGRPHSRTPAARGLLFRKPRTHRPSVTVPRAEPLRLPGGDPPFPACPAGVPRRPTSPARTPPAGTRPFSRRVAPDPAAQPRPPARGLRLPSAKPEFPARRRLRTSGPPRPHSPAAGPAQLRRLRLYLRRQQPPSATTSPMTTGPPPTTLPTNPLAGGAAALCYDWLAVPARHRVSPAPFPGPRLRPRPDLARPRSSFSCNWLSIGQFEVMIGYR